MPAQSHTFDTIGLTRSGGYCTATGQRLDARQP